MEDIKYTVAKNIAFYRKNNNLSQKMLAEKIGVKHNTISSWESCTNSVDIDSLFRICNALNITIYDMFTAPTNINTSTAPPETYTADEQQHINKYRTLNDLGKNKADEYITDLSENPKYTTSENSAPPVSASDLIAADLVKEIKAAKSKTPIK